MQKKPIKIIFITHAFPPLSGGGVQRISKFSIYLQMMGYEVHVYATNPGETDWVDDKRLKDVSSVPVSRIGRRNLSRAIIHKVKRRLLPIDFQTPWALKVTKILLNAPDTDDPQIIITSGPPHSMHIVGYFMKKLRGTPWVADFRDHFTLGPEYRVYSFIGKRINQWFENQIYKNANRIIFNTKINKEDVIYSKFQLESDKGTVIYNGYDESDLSRQNKTISWKGKKSYNYLYLGGLRGDHVDGIFYKALHKLFQIRPHLRSEISIQIVGNLVKKGNLVHELELDDVIFFSPGVPYDEVGDLLNASDGCLTWQRNRITYRGTIAGKVFDYIGAKKPIFSIGIPNGEIENILKEFDIGQSAAPDNIEQIALDFNIFHEQVKTGQFQYTDHKIESLKVFSRKHQAYQLAELIESLEFKK
ncbi:MAG: glycosyltransferase family 4 protein [Chitinophagales bacterium]|nr:glycosyltransferase family 4 protein [Chitinophagales bacterium]